MKLNKWTTLTLLVVGALGVSTLLVVGADRMGSPAPGMAPHAVVPGEPWQIEALAGGGARVMGPGGLVLAPAASTGASASTLGDVERLWPGTSQVAIVAAPGEAGTLEAFVDPAVLGRIGGKLVVELDLPASELAAMRERSPKQDYMESTTRKFQLDPADLPRARQARIVSLSFIPQAQLDEATVIERFGPPGERLTAADGVVHLLYAERGLDIALHPERKDVLRYVAPADFRRLREPLAAPRPASAPSGP